MKLSQLLAIYPQLKLGNDPTQDVLGVSMDSREISKGMVFVAVRGHSFDGHEFIDRAVEKGAIALVVESGEAIPSNYRGAVVEVDDSRSALDSLAAKFYGNPAENLFCVGVTGTNGKTSFTYILECIFKEFGWPTGVMGTVDHHLGEHKWDSQLTTPDAVTLQKRLKEFCALDARAAVFEVSSHALSQKRVDNLPFNAVAFTNLSHDHLDYHKDMESYFAEKQKLFDRVLWRSPKSDMVAVVNGDDPWGRKLVVSDKAKKVFYGKQQSHFQFEIMKCDFSGSEFKLSTPAGEELFFIPAVGEYNVYNAVAAIAVAHYAGVSLQVSRQALSQYKGTPGRVERVDEVSNKYAFVDYAHTPDALTNLLKAFDNIKKNNKKEKIICVFGCGGDRDRSKRPLMLQAALQYSDKVFLTSDNPRTEDPMAIIKDCLNLKSDKIDIVEVEADRRQAIYSALDFAQEGDVILVAGKGHEDYQIIGTEKTSFSDFEVMKDWARGV